MSVDIGSVMADRIETPRRHPQMNGDTMPKRRSFAVLLGGLLIAASMTCNAPVAHAANSGTVMCANQDPVVGVWVQVSGGTSGWAARSGSGYSQKWSYNTQGKSYQLHVGCGGTPQKWASNLKTPYTTSGANATCFRGWGYGGASGWVSDRCIWK